VNGRYDCTSQEKIRMAHASKSDLVRRCFDAYKVKDRSILEALFADSFRFTSPYDDRIDKATYFERCWPNSLLINENVLERIVESGNTAFVTYLCRTRDGKEFRNTEFFTFEGDRIASVDVYFGATYKHGAFVKSA
jgi:ketosteroid isomerase-like protein